MNKFNNKSFGFSLMEVNIAVAMISVGLLAVFSLFPVGLRESTISVEDNHEAMFANHVLCCLEANAAQLHDWSDWSDPATFQNRIISNVEPFIGNGLSKKEMGLGVTFPASDPSGRLIRYEFRVLGWNRNADGSWSGNPNPGVGQNTYMLQLKVKSGVYGDFDTFNNTYVSIVTFTGE